MAVNLMLQMKEKGLQPDQAAQLAQQITAGKIRVSELNGLAGQEQMVSKLSCCCCANFSKGIVPAMCSLPYQDLGLQAHAT